MKQDFIQRVPVIGDFETEHHNIHVFYNISF